MKKTDIALLVLIAGMGVLISFFIAKALLGDPQDDSITIKTTGTVTSDISYPDPAIFNSDALNPTVPTVIGNYDSQPEEPSEE